MIGFGGDSSDDPDEAGLGLTGDESLPWLDSDEYDPDEGAVDTSRIITLAAILIVVLIAAIGGVWWFSNRASGEEIVADGSTIAAPSQPFKERPEDAGGKEFAGTGNVAPGVGEGIASEGELAAANRPQSLPDADAAPRPVISTLSSSDEGDDSQIAVQVGAYGSRATAEAGWATLRRQTTLLNGVSYRVVKGQADIGTVYRLQALRDDLPSARTLCSSLREDGIACNVKQ